MADETIQQRWDTLYSKSDNARQRAEQYAYYTIPSIFPKEVSQTGENNATAIGSSESIGPQAVNHLANKAVSTLFSPDRPFFRLHPNEVNKDIKKLRELEQSQNIQEQQQAKALLAEADAALSKHEKNAITYLDNMGYRTSAVLACKNLIVTGDTLIIMFPDQPMIVLSMRDYVVLKDLAGTDVEIIFRESKAFGTFPPETQKAIRASATESKKDDNDYNAETPVTIYTRFALQEDGRYELTQAADSMDIHTPVEQKYAKDDMPVIHLSWNLITGEDYGRGLVEDYSGAFHMIDVLTDAMLKGATLMSDIKYLVSTKSVLDVAELNASETGTYHMGEEGDVSVIETKKSNDFNFIANVLEALKRQVAQAFLMMQASVRDAERVTQEEIQHVARELEIAHGGVYSRFALDWQKPLARLALKYIKVEMGDQVEPQIITGLDSLSREGELHQLRLWIQDLSMLQQIPENVQGALKLGSFARYTAQQRGIQQDRFVKSDEEIRQDQQRLQQQQQEMMQQQQNNDMQKEAAKHV